MKRVASRTARCVLSAVLALLLLAVGFVCFVNVAVCRIGRERIFTQLDAEPPYDCILVLGAGLRSDGSPSDMLADRLRGAVALYEQGVSSVIVLSGDRSGEDYDEVSAMVSYCLAAGVPEASLVSDPFGFSTYESVVNTLAAGYDRFVVVTQTYHLYRALYIAESLGAESVGFSADYHSYRGQPMRDAREVMARVKDFLLVSFS